MNRFLSILFSLIMMTVFSNIQVYESQAQRFGNFRTTGQTTTSSNANGSQRYYYSNGMIGEAIIEADHDSRSIIVIADEYTQKHIKQIIEQLDRPVQQVLIKVVFVEVTYRDDYDVGIEGSININQGKHSLQSAFGLSAENRGGFYQILERDLSVTMRAIQEVGEMEVLSRPSILTRNNQEAVITIGKEVPVITNSRVTSDGQTINTPTYEDVGIILRVTPFITRDGLVEMILAPEISAISEETVPISDTINSPVFTKRSADTVVVTPNTQTVVIGGLMEDNKTETRKKIPILGDIPLLGMAFRRTEKSNTKTELLIFLTPYVVNGPEELIDVSEQEKNRAELIPKTFTGREMDKYVEPVDREEQTNTESPEEPSTEAEADDKSEESKPTRRNSKGRPY